MEVYGKEKGKERCGYFMRWGPPSLRELQQYLQNVGLGKQILMWRQRYGQ